MVRHAFDPECPGCQPTILDVSGAKLDPDHPLMAVRAIFEAATPEEKEAFHRVALDRGRDPADLACVSAMQLRVQQEIAAYPNTFNGHIDVPSQPRPGDCLAGCVHEPTPWGAHVFYIMPPRPFQRSDGSWAHAQWLVVCDLCLARYGKPELIPLGCDSIWAENAPPLLFDKRKLN